MKPKDSKIVELKEMLLKEQGKSFEKQQDIEQIFTSLLDLCDDTYLKEIQNCDIEYIKQDIKLLKKYKQSKFYIKELEKIVKEKENE